MISQAVRADIMGRLQRAQAGHETPNALFRQLLAEVWLEQPQ